MSKNRSQEKRQTDLLQPESAAGDSPRPSEAQLRAGRGEGGEESGRKPPGQPTVRKAARRDKILFAREQRHRPTRMEWRLWVLLRDHRSEFKFRRQHPLGDFVLDFYCPEAMLCVEIDGPDHQRQAQYDQWRNEQLQALEIVTLRLPEEEVRADVPAAVEKIVEACLARVAPHP